MTQEITAFLQEKINDPENSELNALFGHKDWHPHDFFQTPDSLRLRPAGHQLLKLFFDHEEFDTDRAFKAGELLILSKHINAPFYIQKNKLVLYSNELIVMFKLAGDVTSWLKLFN